MRDSLSGSKSAGLTRFALAICIVATGCERSVSKSEPGQPVIRKSKVSPSESMVFPEESELEELEVKGPFNDWEWRVLERASANRVLQLIRNNQPYKTPDSHGAMVTPAPPPFILRITSRRLETYEVRLNPFWEGTIWYWSDEPGESGFRMFSLQIGPNNSELISLLKR